MKYNHYNIDLLNGNNYEAWKFRVETIFIEYNVDDMIQIEYRIEDYTDQKRREEAKKRDNKCKSIIVQCIEDTQIDIIRNKETGYAMWKSLREIYEKKGLSGQLILRRKLMSMKMDANEKLEDFLSKFDHVLCQLRTSGADIKDDVICILLLALPKSHETVVTVLENFPAEKIDLDFVKARLRAEVEKKNEVDRSQDEGNKPAAFISNNSIICYNCGEHGHIKRNCRKVTQGQHNYNRGRSTTNYRGGSNRGGMNRRDTTQYQYEGNRRNELGEDRPRYQRDRSHRSHS